MSENLPAQTNTQPSNFGTCVKGVIDTMPLSLAVVPWGILCGSLAISAGLSPLQAQLMSLLVFAGAAQLAGVSLLGAGASASAIYSSTFVISSRHLLYSAVFREHVRGYSLWLRSVVAFFLTDEMFALTIAYIEKHKEFSVVYALASGICFYVFWNIATYAGIVAGQHIPNLQELGLEFAIAATFIAIVIPSIKNNSTLMSVLVSGGSILLFSWLEIEQGLIFATLAGMAAGYITWRQEQKRG